MKVPITKPFFDEKEIQTVSSVLESGWIVQGPQTANFEKMFSEYTKVGFAKAVTSCTTAIHIALVAAGVKRGDEVIVPSFTFIATANAVEYIGAVPIFCDIDINTFNISAKKVQEIIESGYCFDESKGHLVNKITGSTLKAIIPVHLFGLAADMYSINEIALKFNLKVIEDAACAVGALIDGKHVGSFGNMACYSFHPRKAITTGEGGMVTTDDGEEAALLEALRNHGATVSDLQRHKKAGYLLPEYNLLGYNYRLTDIQGAIGVEQMKKLPWILNERSKRAQIYDAELSEIDYLNSPFVPKGYRHGYQSYVCLINMEAIGMKDVEKAHRWRNMLMERLEQVGIATRQGTHAVHSLGYYASKYNLSKQQFLASYSADRLSIALPLYVNMTDDEQQYVLENLKAIPKNIKCD